MRTSVQLAVGAMATCFIASAATAQVTLNFTNGAVINIPNGQPAISSGNAGPYPSTIAVAGLTGPIMDVNVSIPNVVHTWASDIDMVLVAPNGLASVVISDVGASVAFDPPGPHTYTIDDEAAVAFPGAAAANGSYRPTDLFGGDVYPAPGPAAYSPTLAVFDGMTAAVANGVWSVYIKDQFAGDVGSMPGGWGMAVQYNAPNDCLNPLPTFCTANVDATGASAFTVDVLDLLKVITTWATSGPPRPVADIAPLPNGDCTTNVLDMLGVITSWIMLPAVGRCCTTLCQDGVTQANCTTAGGTWGGANTTCTGFTCPSSNNEPGVAATLVAGKFPGQVCNEGTNVNATTSTGMTNPSCLLILSPTPQNPLFSKDVWWKYTVPSTPGLLGHILRVDTCQNAAPFTDSVLAIYSGTVSPLSLTEIACGEDAGAACGISTLLSRAQTPLIPAGQTVYVRLANWNNAAGGLYKLCASYEEISQDQCLGAKSIVIGGASEVGELFGATFDQGPVCQGNGPGVAKWFKFVGNGQTIRISTCSSASDTYDGQIVVYCAGPSGCLALNCVASSNIDHGQQNQSPAPPPPYWPCSAFQGEVVDICTNATSTYYVAVGAIPTGLPGGIDGDYTLTLAPIGPGCIPAPAGYPARPNLTQAQCDVGSPPPNDTCATAQVVTTGNTNFANLLATPTAAGAGTVCAQPWSKDVWFRYTSANGGTITIGTMSSPTVFDSVVEVYSGANCAPLGAVLGCSDDFTIVGGLSQTSFTGTAGTTYNIRVTSWSTSFGVGNGILTITDP